jgi:hypothetical protein
VAAAQEFYNYADEHFGWAETAKTERERAIFLQMAAAWLEVAQHWEALMTTPPARPRLAMRLRWSRVKVGKA